MELITGHRGHGSSYQYGISDQNGYRIPQVIRTNNNQQYSQSSTDRRNQQNFFYFANKQGLDQQPNVQTTDVQLSRQIHSNSHIQDPYKHADSHKTHSQHIHQQPQFQKVQSSFEYPVTRSPYYQTFQNLQSHPAEKDPLKSHQFQQPLSDYERQLKNHGQNSYIQQIQFEQDYNAQNQHNARNDQSNNYLHTIGQRTFNQEFKQQWAERPINPEYENPSKEEMARAKLKYLKTLRISRIGSSLSKNKLKEHMTRAISTHLNKTKSEEPTYKIEIKSMATATELPFIDTKNITATESDQISNDLNHDHYNDDIWTDGKQTIIGGNLDQSHQTTPSDRDAFYSRINESDYASATSFPTMNIATTEKTFNADISKVGFSKSS